jgi:serine protease Do
MMKYLLFAMALIALSYWRIIQLSDPVEIEVAPSSQVLPGRLVQETQERTSYRMNWVPPSRLPNQRNETAMLRTFELAIGPSWQSTVRVLSDRSQVALGIVVDPSGLIVTKASQIPDSEIQVQLFDNRKLPAKRLRTNQDLDLAILKVDANNLPAVVWRTDNLARVGTWLATTTTSKTPIGVGVVSVGPRKISSSRPVLGIVLGGSDEGAHVKDVIPGGGAYRAGIEKDDVIVAINGATIPDTDALMSKIQSLQAGQRISVALTRPGVANSFTREAQLMDLSMNVLNDDTEMEVNGNVSARSTGFPKAFQHDTVLSPHQCGGPVIDSHGRVVGINIARAGRVNSYALPLDIVIPAVQELISTSNVPVSNLAK